MQSKFAVLFFISAIAAATACRTAAPPVAVANRPTSVNGMLTTNAPLPPAKPLGEMSWTKFDGFEQKLSDLKGKAVILDFWATNCPPCIEEIPHLRELQAEYGKDRLEIVGLHSGDDEDRLKVPEFVKKLNIDYPLGIPEADLSRFVFAGNDAIPQTLIFDRQGNLVKKFIGFDPTVRSEMNAAVETAVKSSAQ